MEKFSIGVDLGGTNMKCGVVDERGTIVSKLRRSTEASRGVDHVVAVMSELIEETIRAAGIPKSDIVSVGIGTPGFVDPKLGIAVSAANLGWKQIPFAERIREHVAIPVHIDNDVRMYALGEALHGAGQGYRHVLGITLGTGLAAAMIVDGSPYYGSKYMAGELGHIPFPSIPYKCNCGKRGCLETVASATGIARQMKEKLQATPLSDRHPFWQSRDIEQLTAADVSKAIDAGDSVAAAVIEHTCNLLAQGLTAAAALLSPDAIIVGGGVSHAGDRLLKPLKQQLRSLLLDAYWDNLTINIAKLGDDAGIIGSATAARKLTTTT